ncbi:MAG: hypothetical protein HOV80_28745, partial [Polyangiaceae bacterium]|nr:hypothetical protein [Polyangiaceae bacterium]
MGSSATSDRADSGIGSIIGTVAGADEAGGGGTDLIGTLGGDQSGFWVTHENIEATLAFAGDTGFGSDGGSAGAGGGGDAEGDRAAGCAACCAPTAGTGEGVDERAGLATTDGARAGDAGGCDAGSPWDRTQPCEEALRGP